jgi:hypothetical protein
VVGEQGVARQKILKILNEHIMAEGIALFFGTT